MKQTILLASALSTLILLTGCASLTNKSTPPINGIIYDAENKPVPDVKVTIDGKHLATSDIRGHFSLPLRTSDTVYKMEAQVKGYERIEMEFRYTNPTQILYLRMKSGDQILDMAEKAIAEKNWQEALRLISDAEETQCDTVISRYLRAIIHSEQDNPEEATAILEQLRKETTTEPYIDLLLADLYQNRLLDYGQAQAALVRYLATQADSSIQQRLDAFDATRVEKQ